MKINRLCNKCLTKPEFQFLFKVHYEEVGPFFSVPMTYCSYCKDGPAHPVELKKDD